MFPRTKELLAFYETPLYLTAFGKGDSEHLSTNKFLAAELRVLISAFPASESASSSRGIDKTEWFKFDKTFYDACVDPRDYRPLKFQPGIVR